MHWLFPGGDGPCERPAFGLGEREGKGRAGVGVGLYFFGRLTSNNDDYVEFD